MTDLGGADIKEWWASVLRLVNATETVAGILRTHAPNGAGLCTVCGPGDARNRPWPCPTHAMAENALILRAHRDRTERGDHRSLR